MNVTRILAVVVAAVVYFVLGALWYGQLSDAWLAGIGKTMAELEAANPGASVYAVGFASVLAACATLGWLIARTGTSGWAGGAKLGVVVALGFVGAQLALNYGFEARSATLWLINTGYAVVGLAAAGGIIGAWSKPRS